MKNRYDYILWKKHGFYVKPILATFRVHCQEMRKNQHIFREINVCTKEVTKELISRKYLNVIAFYSTVKSQKLPFLALILAIFYILDGGNFPK